MRQRTRLRHFADRLSGIPTELGPRLAYYQVKSGLTDMELARAASITVEYLEHIKKGAREPSNATAAKLVKALDCLVEEEVK